MTSESERAEILATLTEIAQRLEHDRVQRDASIVAAAAAGAGHREIARATGLTHPGVAKIITRTTT